MKDYQLIQARPLTSNPSLAIVVSRFNSSITKNLLEGCVDVLERSGLAAENVTVIWVPGAFEIPTVAKQLALSKNYDAIITLGCVIRGATPHFDYVCGPCASQLAAIGVDTGVPVIFGILTTEDIPQALERSGTKMGNKGEEAACAALEMVSILQQTASTLAIR